MRVLSSAGSTSSLSRDATSPRRLPLVAAGLTFAAAFAVYYLTAYRTIAWWNNAEEALAAHDLGVMSAPGGLISTILGWLVVHLVPATADILTLNLFAGVLAGFVTAGVLLLANRLQGLTAGERWSGGSLFLWLGAVGAALSLGFGEALWFYAVQYTTYVVTPVFTVFILFAMLKWWESARSTGGIRWLFVTMLLFGLDVSVHRTNALLMPGLAVWIALGNPRALLQWKTWRISALGLFLGLSFHGVIMFMAAREPFMNIGDPSTIGRFWDYFFLKMRGGGFLVNLYPRNADFWNVQVADWLAAFGQTFVSTDGPLSVVGVVPLAAGILGLAVMTRRSPRLGIAAGILFMMTVAAAIVYFNIPENYFRSLHRHYLPSLVIFGVFVVFGAVTVLQRLLKLGGLIGRIGSVIALLLLLAVPINHGLNYYADIDGSTRSFARDYAANMLAGLEPDAVLLTTGDNDTFPLWYLQAVEGVRTDVTVLNIPLLNTGWFVRQWQRRDPGLRLDFTDEELTQIPVVPWHDTVVMVQVVGQAGSAALDSAQATDEIGISIQPTAADAYLLPQDYVVLRLVEKLRWERPLYTVASLGPDQLPWLQPFRRPEGLVTRVLPVQNPPIDVGVLERNLTDVYIVRGFDHPSVPLEPPSAWYAQLLYNSFGTLIAARIEEGDTGLAQDLCGRMYELLPVECTQPPEGLLAVLNTLCQRAGASVATQ